MFQALHGSIALSITIANNQSSDEECITVIFVEWQPTEIQTEDNLNGYTKIRVGPKVS